MKTRPKTLGFALVTRPTHAQPASRFADRDALADERFQREPLVSVKRSGPSDSSPTSLRRLHAGYHALADQVALQLGHGGETVEEEPARRGARVDTLIENDEIDSKSLKLSRKFGELADRSSEAVELNHDQAIKLAPSGVREGPIESRPLCLGARYPMVDVGLDDLQAAGVCVGREGIKLGLIALILSGNTHVEGGSLGHHMSPLIRVARNIEES